MESKPVFLKSQASVGKMSEAYWAEIRSASGDGRPIIWSSMNSPAELLATLGYRVIYPENYAATCGAAHVASQFCQIAEDEGYSPDTCVYVRNNLGSLGRPDLCPVGGLPKPDLLLCMSYCQAIVKWYEALSRHFNVPLITLEYPFMHDGLSQQRIQRVSKYATDQMIDAVPLLEKVARRSLDMREFSERVAITMEMGDIWRRVQRLASHVPAPVSVFDLFFMLFPMACRRGMPDGLAFLKDLELELKERIENGIWAVPGEKYRLYFGGIPLWYRIGYLRRRFADHGAVLLTSIYLLGWAYNYDGLDPAKPFEASLPPQIRAAGNGGVGFQSDFLADLVRDYSLDGGVWQLSRSCKLVGIGTYDWMDRFKTEFGLPVMGIEADMCDDRSYSEPRVDSEIASFLELLTSTKSSRR